MKFEKQYLVEFDCPNLGNEGDGDYMVLLTIEKIDELVGEILEGEVLFFIS